MAVKYRRSYKKRAPMRRKRQFKRKFKSMRKFAKADGYHKEKITYVTTL